MEQTDFTDRIVVVDFETVELQPDGSTVASTEYYRDNFRVLSAAVSWHDVGGVRSRYVVGEPAVQSLLEEVSTGRLVAHNLAFEDGVSRCRFPGLKLAWFADTMRMVQVWDNGGDENAYETLIIEAEDEDDEDEVKKVPLSGFGLVKSLKRILDLPDHKLEAHDWLRANVPEAKKGKEGGFLDRLPPDILERYNIADTERTLQLYEHLELKFLELDYNWRLDHELYMSTVKHLVDAKIRGVLVKREALASYVEKVRAEVDEIARAFTIKYEDQIEQVERINLIKRLRKYKKLKGKKAYIRRIPERSKDFRKNVEFNAGSNHHLQRLFMDVMGIEPKFFTAKGSPSFKSALLGQWGDGGEMLRTRRKRGIVLAQSESLLELSQYDDRAHFDLKAVGTSTGRFAGGRH